MSRAKGIDLSSWQPGVNWTLVPAFLVFAIFKSSEGYGYTDPEYAKNLAATKGKRVRGIYHFFRPSLNIQLQANLFSSLYNAAGVELAPVVDFEVTDSLLPVDRVCTALQAFCAEVTRQTGKRVILYTGAWFLNQFSASAKAFMTGLDLWLAAWPWNSAADISTNFAAYDSQAQTFNPTIPAPFSSWVFWQWGSMGNYPGIASQYDPTYLLRVDTNVAATTAAALLAKYGIATAPLDWQTAIDLWAAGLGYSGPGPADASWATALTTWAAGIGYKGPLG